MNPLLDVAPYIAWAAFNIVAIRVIVTASRHGRRIR